MKRLIENLIRDNILKTPRIIDAFYKVDRKDFIPIKLKEEAYQDKPLSIGFSQTISQPQVVAFMLELLQPQTGDKILDIGSGSAWQSCLLADIVGKKGKIFAIERIPELAEIGRKNSKKYDFQNIEFLIADGSKGYEKEALYDRIIVAAAAFGKIPNGLKKQLKIGGKLVIPVDNSIWLVEKNENDEFKARKFPGFIFVPLIEDNL